MTYLGDPSEAGTRFGSSRWRMVISSNRIYAFNYIGGINHDRNEYQHTGRKGLHNQRTDRK